MSTLDVRKNPGRPRVDSEEVRARVQQPLLGTLNEWAQNQGLSRAEAIRRLIELGLEAAKKEIPDE